MTTRASEIAELAELVREMADVLDREARFVTECPLAITGAELRESFRRHVCEHGVEASLAEARALRDRRRSLNSKCSVYRVLVCTTPTATVPDSCRRICFKEDAAEDAAMRAETRGCLPDATAATAGTSPTDGGTNNETPAAVPENQHDN